MSALKERVYSSEDFVDAVKDYIITNLETIPAPHLLQEHKILRVAYIEMFKIGVGRNTSTHEDLVDVIFSLPYRDYMKLVGQVSTTITKKP